MKDNAPIYSFDGRDILRDSAWWVAQVEAETDDLLGANDPEKCALSALMNVDQSVNRFNNVWLMQLHMRGLKCGPCTFLSDEAVWSHAVGIARIHTFALWHAKEAWVELNK